MGASNDVCVLSAIVQDSTGQVFANGTWQLIFKDAPNVPGPSTNTSSPFTGGSGLPITRYYSGSLDGTGAFAQNNIIRNDVIAPAGSKYTLIVAPNASSNAYQVDLSLNSSVVNASAAINAVISNIFVQAFPVAHAYKDSEVIPVPGSGGLYYNVTNRSLRVWDGATQTWLTQTTFVVPFVPIAHNFLTGMDSGGNFSSAQPSASDLSDGLTGTGLVVRQTSPTINSPSLTSPSLDGAFFTFLSKDLSSSPASTGDIRLSNGTVVKYRNLLNSGDITAFQFGLGATDDILRISGGGPIQIPSSFSPDAGVSTLTIPTGVNGNVVVAPSGGVGIVAVVTFNSLSTLAANVASSLLYPVPTGKDGFYRASAYAVVTQQATTSSTLPNVQIASYTDADTNVISALLNMTANSGGSPANPAVGFNSSNAAAATGLLGTVVFAAKGNTNINYSTANYASVGATPMQYKIRIKLEYLGA